MLGTLIICIYFHTTHRVCVCATQSPREAHISKQRAATPPRPEPSHGANYTFIVAMRVPAPFLLLAGIGLLQPACVAFVLQRCPTKRGYARQAQLADEHAARRNTISMLDDPPDPIGLPTPLVSHSNCNSDDGCRAASFLYTGGTLGMAPQNGTLAPKPGYLQAAIQAMPEVQDPSMPELDLLQYDPLIDSSNIAPEDWTGLARQIRDNYYDYDGFVIVHGTDTMAYTASALSFMLEGLGKAVVLTGSMIPLAEVYNDARRNLLISFIFAAQLELCEVAIFFNDRLLRGNRAIKIDSNSLDAFDSPNFPPLATVGATIAADRARWRPPPTSRLRVHMELDASVVCLRLAPGFDDSAIASMIEHATSLKGVVLSLYGTGNGPSHKSDFIDTIKKAIERGVLVVAASQCTRGTVQLDTYEVGRLLLEIGVVSARDMTTEACVTKMAYLFGRGVEGADLSAR